jgi:hypothetical protein
MPALEWLCQLIGIPPQVLSKREQVILEAELFNTIYAELRERFRSQYKNYFILLKFNQEAEDAMLETNMIRYIIHDILIAEDYSLPGIACYTQMPEEVICDIATGRNISPSLNLSRKILALHRTTRPELYQEILEKIIADLLSQQEKCKAADKDKQYFTKGYKT